MRPVLLLLILNVAVFIGCKPKENVNITNPSVLASENKLPSITDPQPKNSPLDKLPNASTGWSIAPCHLVEEEDIRKQLKVEGSIAMIPEVGANAQAITSCTFRWMKASFEKIEAENKKTRDAIAKKGGGTANLKPVVDMVAVSYTGKYNDAAAAAIALKEIATKDKLTAVSAIGDAAFWNPATNQLAVQKGNAIFYIVVEMDAKKNLDYAQGLALAACKRM